MVFILLVFHSSLPSLAALKAPRKEIGGLGSAHLEQLLFSSQQRDLLLVV
jgi:hypothetical protein